jgi:hypothetical protein
MREFFAWLLVLTVVFVGFVLSVASIDAKASYDTVKIHCDTLVGYGEVRIWIDDTTYLIPIKCPAQ